VSRRAENTVGGLGLGLFIAKTLLERTGAGLEFSNRGDGEPAGARVRVTWPRAVIDIGATKIAAQ